MKKNKFLKYLNDNNCVMYRQAKGSHAIFINNSNGKCSTIPLHSDIKEFTIYKICSQLDIPKPKIN
ncbi:MAG: type II toxin-antitoxin system HicA family toxin [bacterium]|nr:type II toxin-antitoxin system HicA family toxin [Candidatus Limimorpha caballi]